MARTLGRATARGMPLGRAETARIESTIGRLYKFALGRTAAPDEIATWLTAVRARRLTIVDVFEAIATSSEALALRGQTGTLPELDNGEFVQLAIESVLCRGAYGLEITRYDAALANAEVSRQALVTGFFVSKVAEDRAQRTGHASNDPTRMELMGRGEQITLKSWNERAAQSRQKPAPIASYPALSIANSEVPKVSAIASLYCGRAYIAQFLDNITGQSIFDQTELIIIDADSPEGEFAIIEPYLLKYDNIVYRRTPERIGIYEAWNIGVKLARGEFITNVNLDDLRRADSFERQAEILDTLPIVDVVYQDFYFSFDPVMPFDDVAAVGARSDVPIVTRYNLQYTNYPHNAPMWRRHLHDQHGLFDESYVSAGDYEFWLRCQAAGATFFKLNDPHVVYYVNPQGISTRAETRGVLEAQRATLTYGKALNSDWITCAPELFRRELAGTTSPTSDRSEDSSTYPRWRYAEARRCLRSLSVSYRTQHSSAAGA